jgi:squalene-hopene/tetraprenyl-beta-curcumene cyclase
MKRLECTLLTVVFWTVVSGGKALGQESPAALDWSPVKAAAYLDGRAGWWMAWPKSARDHGTFCVSCHTATPFALGRPALRGVLGETSASANERKLLDNVATRVRSWHEVEPFYPDQTTGLPKTSESRGTESILDSLILVWNDLPAGHLSSDARLALDNMWALQFKSGDTNGSWAWLQFHNAPWEGDSQFYGNSLAAIAIGSAPGNYQAEPGIQDGIRRLRAWLVKGMDAQTPLDRAVLLWASAKLTGLLTPAQQSAIAAEILARQREDGGFSMSSLVGSWKRKDDSPFDVESDGYATGLIAFALEQCNMPESRPALKRALTWLSANQAKDGRWPASSLNKHRELSSEAGLFMSDAATAYAVLALTHGHAQ